MEQAKKEKEPFDEESTAYVRLGSQYPSMYIWGYLICGCGHHNCRSQLHVVQLAQSFFLWQCMRAE